MTERLPSHPNRYAATLAQVHAVAGDFAAPGPGSADARIDLKLKIASTRAALACRGTEAARDRLAALDHADLWAGTVQDACARGFAVALDEATSLCDPAPEDDAPPIEATDRIVGKALRKRREIALKTKGVHVRFARKTGTTVTDRRAGVSQPDCLRFDDRSDVGDLDGFEPAPGDRVRVFHPGFLQPRELVETGQRTRLTLVGRLGRAREGFPCEVELDARHAEDVVRMRVRVRNEHPDHRLRIRFLGVESVVRHRGTPAWTRVHVRGQSFIAGTIVRACGRLRTDREVIDVPEAQCFGWIEHEFLLGGGSIPEVLEPQTWQQPLELPH